MSRQECDILIIGAGIAGLWLFHRLKSQGYNALLLTDKGIGAGQTLASQGILHSGIKYTLAGKVNDLARSISQMPNRWQNALKGCGDVDLTKAKVASNAQNLFIPKGMKGKIIKMAAQKTFGDSLQESPSPYPAFQGNVLNMNETVLDIPSVVRALAAPYKDSIRQISKDYREIQTKYTIYTAASGNEAYAKQNQDSEGLKTQKRPLLMGLIKNAPFPLYAHFAGVSEKPVATITTHPHSDGSLIWYIGGQVAERPKDDSLRDLYSDIIKAFEQYLPDLDMSAFQWSCIPIDRVEGQSGHKGFLPDTPTIHQKGNHLYCWPTKLTFAPMLADMVMERISAEPSAPSNDWSGFAEADYAPPPWDLVKWTNL